MSAILFHRQGKEDVKLRGSERAHMGCLVNDLMLACLGSLSMAEDWLKPLFGDDSYLRSCTGAQFENFARTLLRVGDGKLHLPGRAVEPWIVALNTAFAIGNDSVKLLARLHAQCEIHCWFEGAEDRCWLSEIIKAGRSTGLMRDGQGWEQVVSMLVEDDGPVVCSYTVTESFPNFGCLPGDHPLKQRTDDERWDAFYDIPRDEAWAVCMRGLRESGGGLQIKRDGWDKFFFDDGTSALNLRALAAVKPEAA